MDVCRVLSSRCTAVVKRYVLRWGGIPSGRNGTPW